MGDNDRRAKTRPCDWCGESTRNAKFCSNRCQGDRRIDGNIKKWLAGEISGSIPMGGPATWIKPYLVKTLGEYCQICGWNERNPVTGKVPIQLEHIDGDWNNNRRDNLTLLCPNHHSLTETYGALNGPASRALRGLAVREGRVRAYRARYGQ